MDDLIEALQIFRKYGNPKYPTCGDHDVIYVCIDPADVECGDMVRLSELGFEPSLSVDGVFCSWRFGSY